MSLMNLAHIKEAPPKPLPVESKEKVRKAWPGGKITSNKGHATAMLVERLTRKKKTGQVLTSAQERLLATWDGSKVEKKNNFHVVELVDKKKKKKKKKSTVEDTVKWKKQKVGAGMKNKMFKQKKVKAVKTTKKKISYGGDVAAKLSSGLSAAR
mmetsp:Transcript_5769/g.8963  ORF Transcript_5769/g.8963 Transcript_5769/m.8963 type:complete len:154 (-) Transcript_5769:1014-1475(-)